jgi:hypothetical protein
MASQHKPKRKKDYKYQNVGLTCRLELVRRIHDS